MKRVIIILILLNISLVSAKTTTSTLEMQKRFLNLLADVKRRETPKNLYALATIYREGVVTKLDQRKAFHLYHKSALKNFSPSEYQLGMAFRHGIGVKINHEKARYWLRKASKHNHRDASIIFRLYYSKKRVIKQYPSH
jgi:hypothetical protein